MTTVRRILAALFRRPREMTTAEVCRRLAYTGRVTWTSTGEGLRVTRR